MSEIDDVYRTNTEIQGYVVQGAMTDEGLAANVAASRDQDPDAPIAEKGINNGY